MIECFPRIGHRAFGRSLTWCSTSWMHWAGQCSGLMLTTTRMVLTSYGGELTPELDLSAGEYMRIDHSAGRYCMTFGQRAHYGGDPTWGDGYTHLLPSPEHALLVATEFCRHFSNAKAGDDAHD